jgi:UDP-N-acetylmuramyl tripeptide synthase
VAIQVDSRRLPGASLFGEEPGAILDVRLTGDDPGAWVGAWERAARHLLGAVGWERERTAWRRSRDDLSLFLSAPADVLYAATEVNELAWASAAATFEGSAEPELAAGIAALRAAIAQERKPAWMALRNEAARRNVAFLADEHQVSLGLGVSSVSFPIEALPAPETVAWDRVADVPVVMVTGTNGKSTTVRLLGAIAAAGGTVPGLTTTDGLRVGAEAIGSGDYSGPEGARRILRDRRVELAILETARGGVQRRGLVVPRIDAAAITNVAEDHLGEFGMHDLSDIADVKMVVARAVRPGGTLVLNAGDPVLAARGAASPAPVSWFSAADAARTLDVASIPMTFGGVAKHNVENALAAVALARALRIPEPAIAEGLASFGRRRDDNPGRLNLLPLFGLTVLIDYAHNPPGMDALVAVARSLPAKRRLLVIGQAGDRDDDALRALARSGWRLRPDAIVVKEMFDYLRGRPVGEIPGILAAELVRLGAAPAQIVHAASELAAVRTALGWAREGDLLVIPTHASRNEVFELIDRLSRAGWKAGEPLPE